MKPFKIELNKLMNRKIVYKGENACPAVGGDHKLELWENQDGKIIEVCKKCQTINYP